MKILAYNLAMFTVLLLYYFVTGTVKSMPFSSYRSRHTKLGEYQGNLTYESDVQVAELIPELLVCISFDFSLVKGELNSHIIKRLLQILTDALCSFKRKPCCLKVVMTILSSV